MNRSSLNILLLILGQGLSGSIISLLTLTSTLLGSALSPVPYLSTVPVMATVVGSTMTVYFASFLMKKYGRRTSFMTSGVVGLIGSLLAIYAIYRGSFHLFILSTFVLGGATVFNQYYRFAAAEVDGDAEFKRKATAFVIGGGVLGGFLGPLFAKHGVNLVAGYDYMGTFIVSSIVFVFLIVSQSFIRISSGSANTEVNKAADEQSLRPFIRSRSFVLGTASCSIGFSVMILLMNATPLAMSHQHFGIESSATVLQWHFVGMYAPALVLPYLIRRGGVFLILFSGVLFFIVGSFVALVWTGVMGYLLSLILVGVGWSFMFTSGTFLVNEIQDDGVKHRLQGISSLCTYTLNLVASLSAGVFMSHAYGWTLVNIVCVAVMIIFSFWFMRAWRRQPAISS